MLLIAEIFTPLAHWIPMKLLVEEPILTPKLDFSVVRFDSTLVEVYRQKCLEALAKPHAWHVKDRRLEIRDRFME